METRWTVAARAASRLGDRLLDLIAPPQCLLSETEVEAPGLVTPAAWAQLTFIAPPVCEACGAPFAVAPLEASVGALCAPCGAEPGVAGAPRLRARAALVYDAASRRLVLDLKHGGRTDGVRTFARWMATAGADVLATAEILIPVPLHPGKLRRRRFNQSFLLAEALGRYSGVAVDPDTLRRVRDAGSQAGLSVRGRARNVAGVFAAAPDRAGATRGRRIVLIDDVYTTGATLQSAARVLFRAGAARVDAITLARVIKPVNTTL